MLDAGEKLVQQLEEEKEARHRIEQRFKSIIENNADGILVVDMNGSVRFANKAAESLLDRSPDELLGSDFGFPMAVDRITEIDLIRRNGRTAVAEMHVTKSEWGDNPVYLATLRDITEKKMAVEELKESRERLDLALSNTNTGSWDWNIITGRVVFDVKWAEIAGYSLEELEPAGIQAWIDLCHPEDLEASRRKLEEHFEGRTDLFKCESRIRHKDGSLVWVLDKGRVIEWDHSGKPLRMIGTRTDITERKQAEEEKERLNAQIQQARKNEALGRMAGAVAHHFNNQLSVIMGNLELALEVLQHESSAAGNVTEALNACRHSSNISRQLLSYLGHNRGRDEDMDLSELCRSYMPNLKSIIYGDVRLESELLEPGPVVRANESDIKQVMTGLVLNAWEAIEDPPGRILLRTKLYSGSELAACCYFPEGWEPKEQSYACLEVADTGCGISREHLDKIFDPFFSTKLTGRGLGLAVVLGIVRSRCGGIAVSSEAGQGTVIRVFLPPAKSAAAPCGSLYKEALTDA